MKFNATVLAAAMLAGVLATQAFARQPMQNDDQMQVEQQACQDDVYALCGQAIPDQNRIETCLRKNWSKVSHRCRSVIASYGKRHRSQSGSNGANGERNQQAPEHN